MCSRVFLDCNRVVFLFSSGAAIGISVGSCRVTRNALQQCERVSGPERKAWMLPAEPVTARFISQLRAH